MLQAITLLEGAVAASTHNHTLTLLLVRLYFLVGEFPPSPFLPTQPV